MTLRPGSGGGGGAGAGASYKGGAGGAGGAAMIFYSERLYSMAASMPMEVMDYKQFILATPFSKYFNKSNECQSIISFFLIIPMNIHDFIPVEEVVEEEVQEDLSVFQHVHLLLDQVPRLKQRVGLEVDQVVMVRDYYVLLFSHACYLSFSSNLVNDIYFLTQDMSVVVVAEESTSMRQQLSIMLTV